MSHKNYVTPLQSLSFIMKLDTIVSPP